MRRPQAPEVPPFVFRSTYFPSRARQACRRLPRVTGGRFAGVGACSLPAERLTPEPGYSRARKYSRPLSRERSHKHELVELNRRALAAAGGTRERSCEQALTNEVVLVIEPKHDRSPDMVDNVGRKMRHDRRFTSIAPEQPAAHKADRNVEY